MLKPVKIGVLTGTFDPIHLGHTALARAAVREFGLEYGLIWVNAEAGHKVGVTPYADRLAMAKLAVAGRDELRVYEGELSRRPHNVETFLKLKAFYPGAELSYVVGADTIELVDRWDNVESVVRNTAFMVAGRGQKDASAAVARLRVRLGPLGQWLRAEVFEFEGYDGASSWRARSQIAVGERPEALDLRVYQYITDHNLYR